MYIDDLQEYPKEVRSVKTEEGIAYFVKNDIFKRLMYFQHKDDLGRQVLIALPPSRVAYLVEENKAGNKPDTFLESNLDIADADTPLENFDEKLTGIIDLPDKPKKSRRKRKNRNQKSSRTKNSNSSNPNPKSQKRRRNNKKNKDS